MLKMCSVAVASTSFSKNSILRQELLQKYPDARFNETGRRLAGADLVQFLSGCERAIIALENVDSSLVKQLPDLKTIAKYGVGLDSIDLRTLAEHKIKFGWSGGVNRRSVAELTLCFALSLLRKIPMHHSETQKGSWTVRPGRELSNCTVGIIGCGHVGKDLVELLKPFGCNILVNDVRDLSEFCASHKLTHLPLANLLEQSDLVSLHVNLNPTSRNLMSRERLLQMKPGAVLVNCARGGIVDELALKEMLASGHIGGAAFDVFAQEPPMDHELLNLPNFLMTPHIGGSTSESILAMGRAAIANLDEAGDPLSFLEF